MRSSKRKLEIKNKRIKNEKGIRRSSFSSDKFASSHHIKMNVKKGVTFYKIETFKDGVKQEIKIDANSGQIVKVENKNKKHILPIEAVVFSKFALSIDEAVAKAQALEAGWSLDEAELDNKNGAWIYKVELKRDRSEKKVIINAQTGEIIDNYTK